MNLKVGKYRTLGEDDLGLNEFVRRTCKNPFGSNDDMFEVADIRANFRYSFARLHAIPCLAKSR